MIHTRLDHVTMEYKQASQPTLLLLSQLPAASCSLLTMVNWRRREKHEDMCETLILSVRAARHRSRRSIVHVRHVSVNDSHYDTQYQHANTIITYRTIHIIIYISCEYMSRLCYDYTYQCNSKSSRL